MRTNRCLPIPVNVRKTESTKLPIHYLQHKSAHWSVIVLVPTINRYQRKKSQIDNEIYRKVASLHSDKLYVIPDAPEIDVFDLVSLRTSSHPFKFFYCWKQFKVRSLLFIHKLDGGFMSFVKHPSAAITTFWWCLWWRLFVLSFFPIQSNFNGSSTYGTMKISSRQG